MDGLVKYGNVEIQLPDENLACFCIFQDLTKLFGVDFQSEAIALLKSELENHTFVFSHDHTTLIFVIGEYVLKSCSLLMATESVAKDLSLKAA